MRGSRNGQPLLDNAWLYGHDVDADLGSTSRDPERR
jgi:hypothetical protein